MNVAFTDAFQSEMREYIEKSSYTPRCPPGGATYSLDEVGAAEEDDDDDNDDDEHSGDDRRSRCKQQDPPGACVSSVRVRDRHQWGRGWGECRSRGVFGVFASVGCLLKRCSY